MARRRSKGKIGKKPKLTAREHRIVAGVLVGKSASRAMVDAGANASSHSYRERLRPGGDLWQAAIEALNKQGATLDHAAKRVKESLDAKRTQFFARQGKVISRRDLIAHEVRLNAADTVYRVNRVYPASKESAEVPSTGPVVKINFLVVGGAIPSAGDGKDNGKDLQGIRFKVSGGRKPDGDGS